MALYIGTVFISGAGDGRDIDDTIALYALNYLTGSKYSKEKEKEKTLCCTDIMSSAVTGG